MGHSKDQCPTKEEEKVVEQVNFAVVEEDSSDVDSVENQAF